MTTPETFARETLDAPDQLWESWTAMLNFGMPTTQSTRDLSQDLLTEMKLRIHRYEAILTFTELLSVLLNVQDGLAGCNELHAALQTSAAKAPPPFELGELDPFTGFRYTTGTRGSQSSS